MTETRIPGGVLITRNDVEAHKKEFLEQNMLIRPREAAAVLACSPSSVQGLVRDGKLAGYSSSGTRSKGVRILAADLRSYINSMKIERDEWRE